MTLTMFEIFTWVKNTRNQPDVLRPATVVIDVQIVEYVTLIARLYKQSSNIEEALDNLSTTWTAIHTITLQGGAKYHRQLW